MRSFLASLARSTRRPFLRLLAWPMTSSSFSLRVQAYNPVIRGGPGEVRAGGTAGVATKTVAAVFGVTGQDRRVPSIRSGASSDQCTTALPAHPGWVRWGDATAEGGWTATECAELHATQPTLRRSQPRSKR